METILQDTGDIPVYLDLNDSLHKFCITMYLRAGSIYECEKENGISHFYEHVAVRNIQYRMNGEFYRTLDKLGLFFDAATSSDQISFEISGAPSHFAEACDLILRFFEPLTLPASEINTERMRIRAEIREEDDKNSIWYHANQIIWEGTNCTGTVLGKSSVISKIGKKALCSFRKKLFSPGNIFLYITGNAPSDVLPAFSKKLSHIILTQNEPVRESVVPVPSSFFHRNGEITCVSGTETEFSVNFDYSTDWGSNAEFVVLSEILFRGETAKIYNALSEKTGFVYSYDDSEDKYKNIGVVSLSFEVQPAFLVRAAEAALKTFQEIKNKLEGEIATILPFYTDNCEMLLDSPCELNSTQAFERHFLCLPYASPKERAEAFSKVTPEGVRLLAQKIFRTENCTVVLRGNRKKLPVQEIKSLLSILKDIP